jgi:hypothetical protein
MDNTMFTESNRTRYKNVNRTHFYLHDLQESARQREKIRRKDNPKTKQGKTRQDKIKMSQFRKFSKITQDKDNRTKHGSLCCFAKFSSLVVNRPGPPPQEGLCYHS